MGDGLLSLAWNNHGSTFCHMLSSLRDGEQYSDVTLACDGKFYPAHKLILSTCSDFFVKIFEQTPCRQPVVVLQGMNCHSLEALLNYMYAGVVSVRQDHLPSLIRAAELLEIKGLAVPDESPATSKRTGGTPAEDENGPHPKRLRLIEGQSPTTSDSETRPAQTQRDGDSVEGQTTSSRHIKPNNRPEEKDRSEAAKVDGQPQPLDRKASEDQQPDSGQLHHTHTLVIKENVIKEEKIELHSEDEEEAEYGFAPLLSEHEDHGGTKEDLSLALPLSQSPSDPALDTQAGPSGLQWQPVGESGDTAGQCYGGEFGQDLPLSALSGEPAQLMSRLHATRAMCEEGLSDEQLHTALLAISSPGFPEAPDRGRAGDVSGTEKDDPVFTKEQEQDLVDYVLRLANMSFFMTPLDLRQLAFEYAEDHSIRHNFNKRARQAGHEWLDQFLSRHPEISLRNCRSGQFKSTQRKARLPHAEFLTVLAMKSKIMDTRKKKPARDAVEPKKQKIIIKEEPEEKVALESLNGGGIKLGVGRNEKEQWQDSEPKRRDLCMVCGGTDRGEEPRFKCVFCQYWSHAGCSGWQSAENYTCDSCMRI